jgi:hypothetical protein
MSRIAIVIPINLCTLGDNHTDSSDVQYTSIKINVPVVHIEISLLSCVKFTCLRETVQRLTF